MGHKQGVISNGEKSVHIRNNFQVDYRKVSKTRSSYTKFGINYFSLILKVVWFLWRYKTIYLSNFSSYIRGRLVIKVVLFWRLYGSYFKSQSASRFALIVPPCHWILAIPGHSWSFPAWSVALKSHFEAAYVVSLTIFCALRAPSVREAGFFYGLISFVKTVTLFL